MMKVLVPCIINRVVPATIIQTLSVVMSWFLSKHQRQETAVARIADAVLPAFHTQFGKMISLISWTAKSPNLAKNRQKRT